MKVSPKNRQSIVVVIDDDPGIREALADLIHSVGLQVETFASVRNSWIVPKRSGPDASSWTSGFPDEVGSIFMTTSPRQTYICPLCSSAAMLTCRCQFGQ